MLSNILKVLGIILCLMLFIVLAPILLVSLWLLLWGGIALVVIAFLIWAVLEWVNSR